MTYRNPEFQTVFTPKRVVTAAAIGIAALVLLVSAADVVKTNAAGHTLVKQAAVTGDMSVIRKPGMFWLLWGDTHDYPQASTLYFAQPAACKQHLEQDKNSICVNPIVVQFNDGAKAQVIGSTRFDTPTDDSKMLDLHYKFRGVDALVSSIERLTNQAVTLTASLMSAEESYTTRRAQFTEMSGDQLASGVYLTQAPEEPTHTKPAELLTPEDTKAPDDAKKPGATVAEKKSVSDQAQERKFTVRILRNSDGTPQRQSSPLADLNVTISQFVVTDIEYDKEVDERIKKKQEALQAAIQAGARAEQAKQQAIEAEQVGLKNVMEAQYVAEVARKKAVVDALREKEVAETNALRDLNVQEMKARTALEYSKQKERESSADADARRRLLASDNGFELKMETLKTVALRWAEAYEKRSGAVVPQVALAGGPGGSGGPADLMSLLTAKLATDFGVNLR